MKNDSFFFLKNLHYCQLHAQVSNETVAVATEDAQGEEPFLEQPECHRSGLPGCTPRPKSQVAVEIGNNVRSIDDQLSRLSDEEREKTGCTTESSDTCICDQTISYGTPTSCDTSKNADFSVAGPSTRVPTCDVPVLSTMPAIARSVSRRVRNRRQQAINGNMKGWGPSTLCSCSRSCATATGGAARFPNRFVLRRQYKSGEPTDKTPKE